MELLTNRGVIFINKIRERDTHSNWKGEINVEGVRYIIDLWENLSQRGEPYYKARLEKIRNQ